MAKESLLHRDKEVWSPTIIVIEHRDQLARRQLKRLLPIRQLAKRRLVHDVPDVY
jgi:hypothetical protein